MADPLMYLTVFERAEDGGYGAWVPDLPGCFAVGSTREECEQVMRGAIVFHVEGMREFGETGSRAHSGRRRPRERPGCVTLAA